jgi:hypothetical protein
MRGLRGVEMVKNGLMDWVVMGGVKGMDFRIEKR